jgi:hypothetical protein
MTTSTPPDNTVLVLSPPMVNGHTNPVEGAHIGVPLVAYDLVTDGEGAVVLVDPPLSGTMDPGDIMELWLEGESAALDSETIIDPDSRTTLRIPKGRLHPDKVNPVFYTVKNGAGNKGTSTPTLEVLYNRIRPGLKDRLTDPGGHSELKLLLPDVIKNGVGPDFVSAEVCVAYPYCRAYDVITLKCNGELLEPKPKVKPNPAPLPPNPGNDTPITTCFTITRDFLDKAKRQDKKLHFSYTVTDQLGNGPDTDAPWSPVQSVDEDLDGTRLPIPILLERKEDYPGDVAEIIDLVKLGNNNLLLVVLTTDNRFVVGYNVIATYIATNTGQPADVVVTVSGKVKADPFGVKQTLFLEVLNDKVFADSSVTVNYVLRKPDDDLVGSSNTAIATVTGSAPIELFPPFLVDAVEPIDVLAYPNGVKIRIEYLDARKDDRARLVEVNPPAGSPQFPLVEFNSNKQVNTVLSPAFLAARHGKEIELRWNLNRNGGQAGKSDAIKVSVLKIVDEDPRFPTPNIDSNTSNELDVQELTTNARILAVKWSLFEPGQPIWIRCTGFNKNGDSVNKDVRSGEPNDSADGLSVEAPIEWLKTLKDGTESTIACAANLDGSAIEATAVSFPLRTYLIKASPPAPLFENFDGQPHSSSTIGQSISIPSMTITLTSGAGTTGIQANGIAIAGMLTGPAIVTNASNELPTGQQLITLSLKSAYSRVRFAYTYQLRAAEISFSDNSGTVGSRNLPADASNGHKWIDFSAPAGRKITSIQIVSRDWSYLDHFQFWV